MKIGVSRHEIEFLFRNAKFNLDQIENIGHICRVLGKYLFVDRTILDSRADRKIGLSYLEKAVKYHIVTEMQYQNGNHEKRNTFYYQLGMGGYYLLEKAEEDYFQLNILADKTTKERILAFNYFALEQGHDIDIRYSQDVKHRFFFCKNGVICYFPRVIKEMEIIRMLIKKLTTEDGSPTVEEIREKFNFMPVPAEGSDIGRKTKTTLDLI